MKLQSSPALLVAFSIVTSSLAPFAAIAPSMAQSGFADVQGNWAQTCISELTQRNIISGYPDGTFRPNNPVTRAEYAAMVGKAFPNAPRDRSAVAVRFVDVPTSYWAYSAISYASQTGFLSGYPGFVFNPGQNIPRAQVLVSLASGLNFAPTQPAANTLGIFADASTIPGYAQMGIAAATEKRLVVNHPDVKYLNPNQLASRADVSAFLCQSLTSTGQIASVVPGQYVAGTTVAVQRSQVVAGTLIPASFIAAPQIIVAPNETVDLTVTVTSDVRNTAGVVAIPAGSQVIGQLVPVNGGSQFVSRTLVISGQQYAFNASSGIVQTKKSVREVSLLKTLGGAALGAGAAAIIGEVTGDRMQNAGNLILASSIGAAVGANQGRNLGSAIRDAAIGAALGAGAAGVTGNRTITPKKVLTGAAAGAAIGGSLDRGTVGEVIVINSTSDLTLTLNSAITLP
jgi:hypothetical protein